jgi:hypothetical protein
MFQTTHLKIREEHTLKVSEENAEKYFWIQKGERSARMQKVIGPIKEG